MSILVTDIEHNHWLHLQKEKRKTSIRLTMTTGFHTPPEEQHVDTLLSEPRVFAGELLKNLEHMSPPARPLAAGADLDSSNTSWDMVNGSGSGEGSVQHQGVGEEVGGTLTGGTSHTRADATTAGIPPTALVMSLSHKQFAMTPDLVADVTKLKTEVKDLMTHKDVNAVLNDMYQQLELTKCHGDETRNMIDGIISIFPNQMITMNSARSLRVLRIT